MNIEFKCPQCGQMVECDEEFIGHVAQCPHCGKGIVVPRGTESSAIPHIRPRTIAPDLQPNKGRRIGVVHVKSKRNEEPPQNVSTASPRHDADCGNNDPGLPQFPSESSITKSFAWYWIVRLILVIVVSVATVFAMKYLSEWLLTRLGALQLSSGHKKIYRFFYYSATFLGIALIVVLDIVASLKLSYWCYKKFVVDELFGESYARKKLSSWLIPILIGSGVGLLIPWNVLLPVLGIYGCSVWSVTIWLGLDYCMFRFISVKLLSGRKMTINPTWLCAAILFCILVVMVFGFGRIIHEIHVTLE